MLKHSTDFLWENKVSRRNGRILAVQALYSYDVGKMPLEELLKLEWIQNGTDAGIVPEEIKEEWISDINTIGICGATSTPKWLMEDCKKRIEDEKA